MSHSSATKRKDAERKETGVSTKKPRPQPATVKPQPVTPSSKHSQEPPAPERTPKGVHRRLFEGAVPVTPSRSPVSKASSKPSPAKKRLIFGKLVEETHIDDNVRRVYAIIRKLTGSLGGNASSGPIYGELTTGSMQKMINLMKKHTNFTNQSRFIDVGSGIGKPNLHVAQDPGVSFSYGIEVEQSRWVLGMSCLQGVLKEADNDVILTGSTDISHRCLFECRDITEADSFDPFTHVYMFSIGFPPTLWLELSEMWNRSESPYLICYHGPKNLIDDYGFDVELITQAPTSMHGSKEGHMGYLYRRSRSVTMSSPPKCDMVFQRAFSLTKSTLNDVKADVEATMDELMTSKRPSRASRA